ncbi:hypothetical protein [Microbacterium enclense]|uniref:hypothetical protein n=1 Tax=Microbacterium enclense TaxID=993073 RepID=UPI003F7DD2F1
MRYSVDSAGVAAILSSVAVHFDDVVFEVSRTLTAVDDAASAFRGDGSGARSLLEAAFSSRRRSGPGLASYASDVAHRLQDAVIAYIAGDDEMAARTDAAVQSVAPSFRRGAGSVIF